MMFLNAKDKQRIPTPWPNDKIPLYDALVLFSFPFASKSLDSLLASIFQRLTNSRLLMVFFALGIAFIGFGLAQRWVLEEFMPCKLLVISC